MDSSPFKPFLTIDSQATIEELKKYFEIYAVVQEKNGSDSLISRKIPMVKCQESYFGPENMDVFK
jgi:hypothetical protein